MEIGEKYRVRPEFTSSKDGTSGVRMVGTVTWVHPKGRFAVANEVRLIDANALLEKFQFRLPKSDHVAECIDECVKMARKIINDAPTVDAVEVVHGRWIPVTERLPQEDEPEATTCEQVQVLLDNGVVSTGWCNRYFKLWWHLNYGETHFVAYDYEHTPVIAWKPLAEPPEGE